MQITIHWNEEKNKILQQKRGVGFEEIAEKIRNNHFLGPFKHTVRKNQLVIIVVLNGYAHFVPYVKMDNEIFLKTIVPSRKLNKKYGGDRWPIKEELSN
jgi:uncharacterized DUF497 family protein